MSDIRIDFVLPTGAKIGVDVPPDMVVEDAVQQLVEAGSITPEQAASHPGKNLITRALGVREDVRPEYQKLELKAGDKLLLCTDGLTNMVPDEAIAATLSNTGFFAAAERLVQMALEGGGTDNVTVLLLGMEPTEG